MLKSTKYVFNVKTKTFLVFSVYKNLKLNFVTPNLRKSSKTSNTYTLLKMLIRMDLANKNASSLTTNQVGSSLQECRVRF